MLGAVLHHRLHGHRFGGQLAVGFGQYVSVSIVPMLQNVSQTTFLCATYLSGVLLNFLMTPLAVLASFGLPFSPRFVRT